jgi:hypothetical protein
MVSRFNDSFRPFFLPLFILDGRSQIFPKIFSTTQMSAAIPLDKGLIDKKYAII